jgi:hypothetical protein
MHKQTTSPRSIGINQRGGIVEVWIAHMQQASAKQEDEKQAQEVCPA